MIERREISSIDDWLAWRTENIGASEVAAIFDLHPYRSRLELWGEKCGRVPPPRETSAMRRGRILESAVAAAVAIERPLWRLIKCRHYYSDTKSHLGATPDYLIEGDPRGPGVLQCKTANPRSFEHNFSAEEPPFWITLQTATEMMLTDAAFGVAAVLMVDGWKEPELRLFDVPRNTEAELRLKADAAAFWKTIEDREQPAADPKRDRKLLPKLIPEQAPGMVIDLTADNELPLQLEQRETAVALRKSAQDEIDSIDASIMIKMGTHERAEFAGDWYATWKVEPRREYLVAASRPRVLRIRQRKELAK